MKTEKTRRIKKKEGGNEEDTKKKRKKKEGEDAETEKTGRRNGEGTWGWRK